MFDDMIADPLNNKKLMQQSYLLEKGNLNSFFFIKRIYFAGPRNIRLNYTHYFVMKIQKK